jgi:hypothetical protein
MVRIKRRVFGVRGWIKTRDHFYLVEDLSEEHIPLADIPTPIQNIALIRKILGQYLLVRIRLAVQAASLVYQYILRLQITMAYSAPNMQSLPPQPRRSDTAR